MEGMLKSAPSAEVKPVISHSNAEIPVHFEGCPIELYRYFGLDIREVGEVQKSQLREIYEALGRRFPSVGDVLAEVSRIEKELGARDNIPARIWHWLKLTGRIEDLIKQREAMRVK